MSGMIPAGALAQARKQVERSLGETATVFRAAFDKESNRPEFLKVYESIACAVNMPKAPQMGAEGERRVPNHDRVIWFPFGSDVKAQDIIRVGGSVYEVVDTDKDRSNALKLQAFCVYDTAGLAGNLG